MRKMLNSINNDAPKMLCRHNDAEKLYICTLYVILILI